MTTRAPGKVVGELKTYLKDWKTIHYLRSRNKELRQIINNNLKELKRLQEKYDC